MPNIIEFTYNEYVLFIDYCKTRKPKEASETAIIDFIGEFHKWLKDKTGDSTYKLYNDFLLIFKKKVFYSSEQDYMGTRKGEGSKA